MASRQFANMQERAWTLGAENVDELYKYKNYYGSFNANIDQNIERTRKKVEIIFAANIVIQKFFS